MRALRWIALLLVVTGCFGTGPTHTLPPESLSPPTGLLATPGDHQVVLSWDPVAGAKRYRVFQGTFSTDLSQVAEVSEPTATVTGLTNDATYSFAVASVSDEGVSEQSAPISASPRASALEVEGTVPQAGAASVSRDQVLQFDFPESVDSTSIELSSTPPQDFTVQAGSWTFVQLVPSGLMQANTTYTVTLKQARGVDGLTLAAPYTLTFTTGATPLTLEETTPTVVSVNPPTAATEVSETTQVTVTFSKPMDPATTQAAFSLSPSVPCTFYWASTQSLTCTPQSPLTLDTQYTVTVGTGATSADEGALPLAVAFSSGFHTRPPDTTPPTLVSFTPAEGALAQARGQAVVLTFSEPMDCDSVKSAFSWDSPARALGTFSSCSPFDNTVTLEADTSFAYGDEVTWTIGAGATDTSGNPLGTAQTHTFTVAHVGNQQLQAVAGLDGFAGNLGQFDKGAATLKVGSTGAENEELRGFVAFDLSALPADTVRIAQATLTLTEVGITGDPFGKLGSLEARKLDFGPSLEQTDFSAPGDTRVDCTLIFFCDDVPDDRVLRSTSTVGPFSVDVSTQISGAFLLRDTRQGRAQFRLHFAAPANADGGTDVVELATGEAAVGAPVLDVTYEYP